MTAKLRAAAQAALARPRFKALINLIPASERDDAKALLGWLTTASEFDRKGGDSDEFHAAYGALTELAAAEDLQSRIAAAYWDPKLRAQYGVEMVERAWHDPATARELLLKESGAGRLSPAADAALTVIYEAEHFASEQGAALPPPTVAPIPNSADGVDAEYRDLISKGAIGKLTKAEDDRLTELAEGRVAREVQQEAAQTAAGGTKPVPDEYQRLIRKSAGEPLSAADDARLTHLAEQRAIASGEMAPEDVEDFEQEE